MEAKNENHIMWKFCLVIALVSAVISIPLNMIFWGGQTSIAWGDELFAYMTAFRAQNLVEAGIVLFFTLALVFVLPVFSRNLVTKKTIMAFLWLQTLEEIGFQKFAWLTKVGGNPSAKIG